MKLIWLLGTITKQKRLSLSKTNIYRSYIFKIFRKKNIVSEYLKYCNEIMHIHMYVSILYVYVRMLRAEIDKI